MTEITVREASNSQIAFQLLGDNAPINLTGVNKVQIVLVPDNGTGTAVLYNTTDDPTSLAILSATLGKVGFTPDGSTDLLEANSPYKVFFWVFTGATTKYAVPDEEEMTLKVTNDYV